MAKSAELIAQFQAVLPLLTNYFSDEYTVTSLVRTGSTVTVTTSTAHGLTTGNIASIIGVECPVQITSLTSNGTIASGRVDTATPHDLTYGWQPTIKITGAIESPYNGDALPLLSVPNRVQFTYQLPSATTSPATGSPILLYDGKERGYNGNFIVTVVSPTVFTYPISGTPYDMPTGNIKVRVSKRISGTITAERAEEVYTKQADGKLWGFVVKKTSDINKDRTVMSDAVQSYVGGGTAEYRQREIQVFEFYIFVPTSNQLSARAASDLMEYLKVPIYRSILGFVPMNQLTDNTAFSIGSLGHEPYKYEKAYYIHCFKFECLNDITYKDTVLPPVNVAFRDVYFNIINSPDEPIEQGVNLDVEPYTS